MASIVTYSGMGHRLLFGLCILSILLLLAALPAFGQHVHQLAYNRSTWVDEQLPGAQTTVSTSIASILTTPNNQQHVYYFAGEGEFADVHQLFYNGTNWADGDLTAETGAPQADPFSVAAFSFGNYQYVHYVDLYGHVHQLLYNNSGWADTDLTEITGGPQARGQLVAFTTSPAVHVFYTEGDNNDVHQIFNTNGTNWQDQDLTALTGGATVGGQGVSGFNIGNYQYIYFLDGPGHVHQFLYNNSTWSDEDLTASTKSLPSQFWKFHRGLCRPGHEEVARLCPGGKSSHFAAVFHEQREVERFRFDEEDKSAVARVPRHIHSWFRQCEQPAPGLLRFGTKSHQSVPASSPHNYMAKQRSDAGAHWRCSREQRYRRVLSAGPALHILRGRLKPGLG